MLKISYKNNKGLQNTNTHEVYFYHFKYKNILFAIKNLENDINDNIKTTQIIDALISKLNFE